MEDTVFCGVFDGHGPYGHVIAKRVRDLLPLKLGSHLESYLSCEEVLKEISLNTADRMTSDSLVQISANGESRVYNKDQDMVQMLLTSIVKAYRFMDKELKMQVDVDCFCSGTTAVTMVKQVDSWTKYSHVVSEFCCEKSFSFVFFFVLWVIWFRVNILLLETLGIQEQYWVRGIKRINLFLFS